MDIRGRGTCRAKRYVSTLASIGTCMYLGLFRAIGMCRYVS